MKTNIEKDENKQSCPSVFKSTEDIESDMIVLVYPNNIFAKSLIMSLELLINKESLYCEIFNNHSSLVSKAHNLSKTNFYRFKTDVLMVNFPSKSEIKELNIALRSKHTHDSKGWAGQIITITQDNTKAIDLNGMSPFSILGGLIPIPNNAELLLKLIKAVFDRPKYLAHNLWESYISNVMGLSSFWREIGHARKELETGRWEIAIQNLRSAVTSLIENPENEILFGHDRFSLLKTAAKIQIQLPNESSVLLVNKIIESMKPFQI